MQSVSSANQARSKNHLIIWRRLAVVILHVGFVVFSNYLAFWLRFDGVIPPVYWALYVQLLPWLVGIRGLTFIPFRLYSGLWRYTSIWDLRNIIAGVAVSSALFFILVHLVLGITNYPRSIFILDSLLLVFFMGGIRMTRRVYRELGHFDRSKQILIYGAGDAGERIVRDLRKNPHNEYEPVGFIDDDLRKVGQRIHGVEVIGTRKDLAAIMSKTRPDAIVVAMPRTGPATVRGIVKALEPFKIPIKTLPHVRELLDGTITVSQIRNLAIEDLLERAPVGLETTPVKHLIRGQRILVTGAGGSIGAELCRQILACHPAALVLLDRYENGLYSITSELTKKAKDGSCNLHSLIGDVTDAMLVDAVMDKHRPSLVFHAAAHKHVPLMEYSPCEAVKNNVTATRVLADAADRAGVQRFILISTDKAVNPISVMGVTKRVAELMIQAMAQSRGGVFSAVRFGNVLFSNGSAVPRFMEQIRAGEPVTITHPEMRRFFMLIQEAVQLVLHAATLAKGGEIFVLEMGEQIKVLDMVRNLITLSGFSTEEIPIQIIGVRPGEKLSEELVGEDEIAERCDVVEIFRVRPRWRMEPSVLGQQITELEALASKNDAAGVIRQLSEIVPTYSPTSGILRDEGKAT